MTFRRLSLVFAFMATTSASLSAASPTPGLERDRKEETLKAVVGVKVLFRNDKDEVLLVYDDRRQAWEVPGATHQGEATARSVLDALARDVGITYTGLGLGGLFTYHNPENGMTIVRPYYTARLQAYLDGKGLRGEGKPKWFALAEAKEIIPYPASVQIVERLSRQPEHIWAAAFEEYGYTSPLTDRKAVKFRVLEDFYPLK